MTSVPNVNFSRCPKKSRRCDRGPLPNSSPSFTRDWILRKNLFPMRGTGQQAIVSQQSDIPVVPTQAEPRSNAASGFLTIPNLSVTINKADKKGSNFYKGLLGIKRGEEEEGGWTSRAGGNDMVRRTVERTQNQTLTFDEPIIHRGNVVRVQVPRYFYSIHDNFLENDRGPEGWDVVPEDQRILLENGNDFAEGPNGFSASKTRYHSDPNILAINCQRKNAITRSDFSGRQTTKRSAFLSKRNGVYGFVLCGAKSNNRSVSGMNFTTSPHPPALQYLQKVDKGSAAYDAGLRAGDFLLEVNGVDVRNDMHERTVELIRRGGDNLRLVVLAANSSPPPSSISSSSSYVISGDEDNASDSCQVLYSAASGKSRPESNKRGRQCMDVRIFKVSPDVNLKSSVGMTSLADAGRQRTTTARAEERTLKTSKNPFRIGLRSGEVERCQRRKASPPPSLLYRVRQPMEARQWMGYQDSDVACGPDKSRHHQQQSMSRQAVWAANNKVDPLQEKEVKGCPDGSPHSTENSVSFTSADFDDVSERSKVTRAFVSVDDLLGGVGSYNARQNSNVRSQFNRPTSPSFTLFPPPVPLPSRKAKYMKMRNTPGEKIPRGSSCGDLYFGSAGCMNVDYSEASSSSSARSLTPEYSEVSWSKAVKDLPQQTVSASISSSAEPTDLEVVTMAGACSSTVTSNEAKSGVDTLHDNTVQESMEDAEKEKESCLESLMSLASSLQESRKTRSLDSHVADLDASEISGTPTEEKVDVGYRVTSAPKETQTELGKSDEHLAGIGEQHSSENSEPDSGSNNDELKQLPDSVRNEAIAPSIDDETGASRDDKECQRLKIKEMTEEQNKPTQDCGDHENSEHSSAILKNAQRFQEQLVDEAQDMISKNPAAEDGKVNFLQMAEVARINYLQRNRKSPVDNDHQGIGNSEQETLLEKYSGVRTEVNIPLIGNKEAQEKVKYTAKASSKKEPVSSVGKSLRNDNHVDSNSLSSTSVSRFLKKYEEEPKTEIYSESSKANDKESKKLHAENIQVKEAVKNSRERAIKSRETDNLVEDGSNRPAATIQNILLERQDAKVEKQSTTGVKKTFTKESEESEFKSQKPSPGLFVFTNRKPVTRVKKIMPVFGRSATSESPSITNSDGRLKNEATATCQSKNRSVDEVQFISSLSSGTISYTTEEQDTETNVKTSLIPPPAEFSVPVRTKSYGGKPKRPREITPGNASIDSTKDAPANRLGKTQNVENKFGTMSGNTRITERSSERTHVVLPENRKIQSLEKISGKANGSLAGGGMCEIGSAGPGLTTDESQNNVNFDRQPGNRDGNNSMESTEKSVPRAIGPGNRDGNNSMESTEKSVPRAIGPGNRDGNNSMDSTEKSVPRAIGAKTLDKQTMEPLEETSGNHAQKSTTSARGLSSGKKSPSKPSSVKNLHLSLNANKPEMSPVNVPEEEHRGACFGAADSVQTFISVTPEYINAFNLSD